MPRRPQTIEMRRTKAHIKNFVEVIQEYDVRVSNSDSIHKVVTFRIGKVYHNLPFRGESLVGVHAALGMIHKTMKPKKKNGY